MENLTPDSIKFPNDTIPPQGFTAPGKSLISEIERLRDAVLMLCELQKEVAKKLEALTNNPIVMGERTTCHGNLNG